MTRSHVLPGGFIATCPEWLHEIKHDGFRVIASENGARRGAGDFLQRPRRKAAAT